MKNLVGFAFCVVAAFLAGRFSSPDTKRTVNTRSSPPIQTVGSGPRYQGRLAQQTAVEESHAQNWTKPSGDKPVFTMDWVSGKTGNWERFLGHLKGKPGVHGLEIGSFEGRSAIWFLDMILTGEGSKITCVDLFGERLDEFFDHNLKVTGHSERVIKVQGKSQHVIRAMAPAPKYDFIYVDGCHLATCAMADMVLSWDLLKPGGIMIIDDYGWRGPALERPAIAVDAFLESYEPSLELLAKDSQVIVRKTADAY